MAFFISARILKWLSWSVQGNWNGFLHHARILKWLSSSVLGYWNGFLHHCKDTEMVLFISAWILKWLSSVLGYWNGFLHLKLFLLRAEWFAVMQLRLLYKYLIQCSEEARVVWSMPCSYRPSYTMESYSSLIVSCPKALVEEFELKIIIIIIITTTITMIATIALKGTIRDFYNLLTVLRTVSNTYALVAKA